ncbi:MAG TPA: hypothetical protein DEO38_05130 [Bacteroidales bacterium]|nr:hypothetical protein [Bacteroidales bacterium]
MQQEARIISRHQWLLISVSAVLLVALVVAHGLYRGLHKSDYDQMLRRGKMVAVCDSALWCADGNSLVSSVLHAMADSAGIELEVVYCSTVRQMEKMIKDQYADVGAIPTAKTREVNNTFLCSKALFSTPFAVVNNIVYSDPASLENLPLCQLHIQDNDAITLRLEHLAGELGAQLNYRVMPDKHLGELIRLVHARAIRYTVCPIWLATRYELVYDDIEHSDAIGIEQQYVMILNKKRAATLDRLNRHIENLLHTH